MISDTELFHEMLVYVKEWQACRDSLEMKFEFIAAHDLTPRQTELLDAFFSVFYWPAQECLEGYKELIQDLKSHYEKSRAADEPLVARSHIPGEVRELEAELEFLVKALKS